MSALVDQLVKTSVEIPTWFGIGGRADHFAAPHSMRELRELLVTFEGQSVRVLGDGANILVDDAGIDGLVVSLRQLNHMESTGDDPQRVRVGAGVNLPKLITQTVREGFAGLETLAGIPASVGGAVRMNAGGAFGAIGPLVRSVDALTTQGEALRLEGNDLRFGYRTSGLEHLIITGVELALAPVTEPLRPALRQKLKDVMAYKKHSQPMAADSGGCVFKNPVVDGARVSAGKLIDEANCKGLRAGGAEVSSVHANFIVTNDQCQARAVCELMDRVRAQVREHHGVELEPEIVIWRRGER